LKGPKAQKNFATRRNYYFMNTLTQHMVHSSVNSHICESIVEYALVTANTHIRVDLYISYT